MRNACNVTVPEEAACNYLPKDVTCLAKEEVDIEKKKYKKVTNGDAFGFEDANINKFESLSSK